MDILRKLSVKKILGAMFFLSLFGVFGNLGILGTQDTHAQVTPPQSKAASKNNKLDDSKFLDKVRWKVWIMNTVLKVIYMLLWPLMVIAGISLDNSMVYGSIFHLDVPLWRIWNIIKNFANFTLWFMVLFEIVRWLFSFGDDAVKKPIKVITNALIAGVLIQSSWFIVGAVIDISTIATYAIGGLPTSVLGGKENKKLSTMAILGTNINIDLEKADDETFFSSNTSYGEQTYISTCKVETTNNKSKYIIGRNDDDDKFRLTWDKKLLDWNNEKDCDDCNEICSFGFWNIILFKGLVNKNDKNETYSTLLKTKRENINESITDFEALEKSTEIVNITKPKDEMAAVEKGRQWLMYQQKNHNWSKMEDLVSKSKWFSHVLVTMYSSFMDFASLSDINITETNIASSWLELVIKLVLALALLIPLILLAAVLIARIGYLWLIIAFSPFLILKRVFFKDNKIKALNEIPSIGDILWIIFAPVTTVFVLAIALIFMSALIGSINNPEKSKEVYKSLRVEQTGTWEYSLFNHIANISNSNSFNNGSDMISWLIVNLFAIALVWIVFFAALKANKVWEKIIWDFDPSKLMGNILKSIPIFRMKDPNNPWKTLGIGLWAISQTPRYLSSAFDTKAGNMWANLSKAMWWSSDSDSGSVSNISKSKYDYYQGYHKDNNNTAYTSDLSTYWTSANMNSRSNDIDDNNNNNNVATISNMTTLNDSKTVDDIRNAMTFGGMKYNGSTDDNIVVKDKKGVYLMINHGTQDKPVWWYEKIATIDNRESRAVEDSEKKKKALANAAGIDSYNADKIQQWKKNIKKKWDNVLK